MGTHAAGPPADPDDEMRQMFQVEIAPDSATGVWGALALTVALGAGAWALEVYTRGSLGAWRFALVVPLVLGAAFQGFFVVLFLPVAIAAKATAPGAPRWLRFLARHAGNGFLAMLLVDLLLASLALSYPQPRPWQFYALISAAGFVGGVVVGVRRRRRRWAAWRAERGSR
ncbi:hypothetical protein KDL01_31775 [Actinospica durhamensis]|uniref:Uncharacterized protein n=1 Tax=Actinospica durhamensis TaxID=1508375 RepID=A0A941IVW5_9ACTN|nr:hypothetical protein [Actinospica durhamensis]MBR7837896.1 hypothetical protein [Actinospica durhamensis]